MNRDKSAIREAWRVGLEAWWPTVQDLGVPKGCVGGSLAGYAYERNRLDTGFAETINDLPPVRSVLIVGGGPSAKDFERAVHAFRPDFIFVCKNYLREFCEHPLSARIFSAVVDSEIDATWQVLDYPKGCVLPAVWNACIMRVPGRVVPSRIYWARWKIGGHAEGFPSQLPQIPYCTSAEGALWLAANKMGAKRIGCIGIECDQGQYADRAKDVQEILDGAGVEIFDYAGSGVVHDWIEQWHTAPLSK